MAGDALLHWNAVFDQENWEIGGAKRDRTADLYNAIVALSQLNVFSMAPNLLEYHAFEVKVYSAL